MKQEILAICSEIYRDKYKQMTVDFIHDTMENADDPESIAYNCQILLEVFNPALKTDISLLSKLLTTANESVNYCTDSNSYTTYKSYDSGLLLLQK